MSNDRSRTQKAMCSRAIVQLPPFSVIVPRRSRKRGTLKHICLSIRLSVHHKNFNLDHIFWSINDGAFIIGMHDPLIWHHAVNLTLTYFKVLVVTGRGTTYLRFFSIPFSSVGPKTILTDWYLYGVLLCWRNVYFNCCMQFLGRSLLLIYFKHLQVD